MRFIKQFNLFHLSVLGCLCMHTNAFGDQQAKHAMCSHKNADAPAAIHLAKRLLEWNRQKLTHHSHLTIEDIDTLFASAFTVIANGREYHANHQNYYAFLNTFRATIDSISYQVQDYFYTEPAAVFMPLVATVKRLDGKNERFDAILFLKFDDLGKIIHWQEVYAQRPL